MNPLIINRDQLPAKVSVTKGYQLPADHWYQIEVTGEHENKAAGITQVIDQKAIQSIIAQFNADKEEQGDSWSGLLIDKDHLSHAIQNSTDAQGWLIELKEKDGQLHGQIRWTDLGEQTVRGGRLRRFSTEYQREHLEHLDGNRYRPLQLSGLALTNRPNNKGGKPISNRTNPPNQSPENENPNNNPQDQPNTMKEIAQKLGLDADATEETILQTIQDLQDQAAQAKAAQAEAEVEEILNRHTSRLIPGNSEQRKHMKTLLIHNREAGENLLKTLPENQQNQQERIHNRAQSSSPSETFSTDNNLAEEAKRAQRVLNRAQSIQAKEGIPFAAAHSRANTELA